MVKFKRGDVVVPNGKMKQNDNVLLRLIDEVTIETVYNSVSYGNITKLIDIRDSVYNPPIQGYLYNNRYIRIYNKAFDLKLPDEPFNLWD